MGQKQVMGPAGLVMVGLMMVAVVVFDATNLFGPVANQEIRNGGASHAGPVALETPKIPPVLIFITMGRLAAVADLVPGNASDDPLEPNGRPSKLALLARNVRTTIAKYDEAFAPTELTVRLLREDDCRAAITEVEPRLLEPFNLEKQWKFKADLCRVAALYTTGGYYFDIDEGPVLRPAIPRPPVTFASVLAANQRTLAQGFIATTPRHPILELSLKDMIEYFAGTRTLHGLLGPSLMKDAYDEVKLQTPEQLWLLREGKLGDHGAEYPDVPRQNTSGRGVTWGCNFIVHDPEERVFYFFTRAQGTSLPCSAAHK